VSTETRIEAPTDPQLDYIATLCHDRGWKYPQAIHSKTEASEIIAALLNGSYDFSRYSVPPQTPEDDDVPF
jgi:hypothetical protein